MAIRIGDEAPDFTAETTEGTIHFHEWIGDKWAILFSHPKDFTPVCTTELGYMAGLKTGFDRRHAKVVGVSVDPVSDHARWLNDIKETQGHAVNYPLIGDADLTVAKLYDMIHPNATGGKRTAVENATVRSVFVIGPDKKVKAMIAYPMSTGRNFDEVLRLLDSVQLTAKHTVATPVNWKPGQDVIIPTSVSDDDARKKYPQGLRPTSPICVPCNSRSREECTDDARQGRPTDRAGRRPLEDIRCGDRGLRRGGWDGRARAHHPRPAGAHARGREEAAHRAGAALDAVAVRSPAPRRRPTRIASPLLQRVHDPQAALRQGRGVQARVLVRRGMVGVGLRQEHPGGREGSPLHRHKLRLGAGALPGGQDQHLGPPGPPLVRLRLQGQVARRLRRRLAHRLCGPGAVLRQSRPLPRHLRSQGEPAAPAGQPVPTSLEAQRR